MGLEWRWEHQWKLKDAEVHLLQGSSGDGWLCCVNPDSSDYAFFVSSGLPRIGLYSFGPFPSLAVATETAAAICGCAPQKQQNRVYTVEGVPVQIRARSKGVGQMRTRIYSVHDSFERRPLDEGIIEGIAWARRRRAVHQRWKWPGEYYERLSDAQGAVERWASERRLQLPAPALLRFQALTTVSRPVRRATRPIRGLWPTARRP